VIANNENGLPTNLNDLAADRGGVVTATIPQIGVAVVESSNNDFPQALQRVKSIQAVITGRMFCRVDCSIDVGTRSVLGRFLG